MIDDQNWKSKECDNHGARTTQLRSGRGYHAISIRLRDELEKIWMLWAHYLWHWNTELFLCSRQRGMTISNWFLLWEGMFNLQFKTPKNQLIYHFLDQFWGCKTWYNPTSYIIALHFVSLFFILQTHQRVLKQGLALSVSLTIRDYQVHSCGWGVSLTPGWWWLMVLQISVWSPPPPLQADTHAWPRLRWNNWIRQLSNNPTSMKSPRPSVTFKASSGFVKVTPFCVHLG